MKGVCQHGAGWGHRDTGAAPGRAGVSSGSHIVVCLVVESPLGLQKELNTDLP